MLPVAATFRCAIAATVIALAGMQTAQASFITTSADPFPPGSGYTQANGCVTSGPLAGLCTSNVFGKILSATSSFAGGDEFVVLNELVTGDLGLGSTPIGVFSVTGALDLTLAGRGSANQTGTFLGTVTFLDYTGSILGIPLEFTLDPTSTSTAQITIARLQESPPLYRIDSFFDIFSDISIEGGAPIPVGSFPITGVAAPEPATLALLGLPLIAIAGLRRRAG
jgi:hypothetical protein